MTSTIQTIKPDFDKVIKYSQCLNHTVQVNTDTLLEDWYFAKSGIIAQWGGKLIVESEVPVHFELSVEEKSRRLNEFIDTVSRLYYNHDLVHFLDYIPHQDFFENRLSSDFYYGDEKILKGTKVVKAFRYFENDKKVLTELQNMASMIIQEDKIVGTLCLSVHPLDFLSSSENTYHWRSCHALDGEYRGGNLSYMLDKSTIVCYLKSADDKLYKLPNFPEDVPWNSKKWRMLLFREDAGEALFAGRQYPFSSPSALDLVFLLYTKYTDPNAHWSCWYNDYIEEMPRTEACARRDRYLQGRHIGMKGRIYNMNELVTDAEGSLHFNDLTRSSFYIPYYCWNYYPANENRKLHFSIGAAVPCAVCGSHIDIEGSLVCSNCGAECCSDDDNYTYCACCERRIHRNIGVWMESIDDVLCPDCFESETVRCDHCGDRWYMCDITYDREKKQHLCPNCQRGENSLSSEGWDWILPF